MNLSARVVAPIVVALLCTGALLILLWWQLVQSTELLRSSSATMSSQNTGNQTATTTHLTEIDPRDQALMHLRQGDLFALKGNWFEAGQEYELSVTAGGGLPALRKLAQAQMQRRDMEGAQKTVAQMKSQGAKTEDLLLLESIVHLRTGELVQARTLLTTAEDSPQKHYGLSLLSIIEGNHQSAKEELQLVITGWEPILRSNAKTLLTAYDEFEMFPTSPDIHLITLLARSLAQVQECELALPLLVQVTTQKEDYRDAWIIQGYCELTTSRSQQALASLEQAYSIDPLKPETQYFLGRTYADLEDHTNAITFLEYALENGFEPKAEVQSLIAEEALADNQLELALKQFTLLTQGNEPTIDAFSGLIRTFIAIGQTEEAYIQARAATERWPKEGRAYELLGISALASARTEEARTALQQALELNPFLSEAQTKLESIVSP